MSNGSIVAWVTGLAVLAAAALALHFYGGHVMHSLAALHGRP